MTGTPAHLQGDGTPEQVWLEWSEPRRWPALRLEPAPATVVAVAPHPDDEVLAIGGLLALLARAGTHVHLIAVTDGEGSHPGSPTLRPNALARRRLTESAAARARLGLSNAAGQRRITVERLGMPDGGVTEVERREAAITAAVIRAIAHNADRGNTWCLAPWSRDGHPDHDAAGHATVDGAQGTARVLSYPVWMWHWARPSDPRVPWSYAVRVPLPDEVQAAKREAIGEFATQIAPLSDDPRDAAVLGPAFLARMTRPYETLFDTGW